jgi:hypothetical protein
VQTRRAEGNHLRCHRGRGADLAFAAIDLGGYWTGAGDLLAFLRNGSYRMLDNTVILDFKRIVGSFPEASTFAYFTLGFCLLRQTLARRHQD